MHRERCPVTAWAFARKFQCSKVSGFIIIISISFRRNRTLSSDFISIRRSLNGSFTYAYNDSRQQYMASICRRLSRYRRFRARSLMKRVLLRRHQMPVPLSLSRFASLRPVFAKRHVWSSKEHASADFSSTMTDAEYSSTLYFTAAISLLTFGVDFEGAYTHFHAAVVGFACWRAFPRFHFDFFWISSTLLHAHENIIH